MALTKLFKAPALDQRQNHELLNAIRPHLEEGVKLEAIDTEYCYHIQFDQTNGQTPSESDISTVMYLLEGEGDSKGTIKSTFHYETCSTLIEIGPRLCFSTSWCSNAVSVARSSALSVPIQKMERSIRYSFRISSPENQDSEIKQSLKEILFKVSHDRMTEEEYTKALETFEVNAKPKEVFEVDILGQGEQALRVANQELGLAFDEQDIAYYTKLFQEKVQRNPSSVEIFDIAQSNSEHSRHWFFKGHLYEGDKKLDDRLWDLVKRPFLKNPKNSVLALCDNASAIKGFDIETLLPSSPGSACAFAEKSVSYDLTLTAETHNFPSGIAPFPGAETGTGGRLRDGQAAGRGSLVIASTAAYCVGNLFIPNYPQEWENKTLEYPSKLASPLKILIQASNGASDYGNKFGEPLVQGYTRSFGLQLSDGSRREWIKPIMFSGGIGQMSHDHLEKQEGEKGMLIVKLGGPAYRIGMGGGAASSMVQGENDSSLDFDAVQRGDAEMSQRVSRAIRACVELGEGNPIVSIHDQGAGGSGNVLKEIAYPKGGVIDIRKLLVGDESMSVLELWGAEYQENYALLLNERDLDLFDQICERENAPYSVVGHVSGDGKIKVIDSNAEKADRHVQEPVDLELDDVLGDMPAKDFILDPFVPVSSPLIPESLGTFSSSLSKVLRLASVCSKRFLTTKVDRSVTGLVAQQQCVGPLHTPLADVAVVAQSHLGLTGTAFSIGEQPIKGLLDPEAMARLSVGESLTNLLWALCTCLEDVKCSGNWMYAAKLSGEGMAMFKAAQAMSELMIELGIAIDGGKDSLSMAALVGKDEIVKAPGSLVISSYVSCPDITKTVTPDLKPSPDSCLVFIDLSSGHHRMGGSAFCHVHGGIGDVSPDLEDAQLLKRTFESVQMLINDSLVLAGHDRSDGGLITCLLEMCFAGNIGVNISCSGECSASEYFFNEELGVVLQISQLNMERVSQVLSGRNIPFQILGHIVPELCISVSFNNEPLITKQSVSSLREQWEETSFRLDALQANPECVAQEQLALKSMRGPSYHLSYTPLPTMLSQPRSTFRVGVIRQEGSNGDREMIAAFHLAGFEAWDIHMSDLLSGKMDLDRFNGVAFVGGFSFADVFGSGRGWASTIKFHRQLLNMFEAFRTRPDTFSLGVCNGCQLLTLLGWVSPSPEQQVEKLYHNDSGRYESRFVTLRIDKSPSVMLRGMEGSVLGCWAAHGEGKFILPANYSSELIPIKYVDEDSNDTQMYPFNPNGSERATAALTSPDGRHLAMMPHPERVALKWQWPLKQKVIEDAQVSPWLTMFQNARKWCESLQE